LTAPHIPLVASPRQGAAVDRHYAERVSARHEHEHGVAAAARAHALDAGHTRGARDPAHEGGAHSGAGRNREQCRGERAGYQTEPVVEKRRQRHRYEGHGCQVRTPSEARHRSQADQVRGEYRQHRGQP
jgi:hypothetical protein